MSPAERLVYDAIARHGGVEQLEAVRTLSSEVDLVLHRKDSEVEVSVHECWDRSGRLFQRVDEGDGVVNDTAWDGTALRSRYRLDGEWSPVETFAPEDDPEGYEEVQKGLHRINRLLELMSPGTTFARTGRKLVRIRHNLDRSFSLHDLRDPQARRREPGRQDDPLNLSILEVIEIERRDPAKPGWDPVRLYIDDTAGSPTRGFIIGIIGRGLDGSADTLEALWCRDFLVATGTAPDRERPLRFPRRIQIYRTSDISGPQAITTEVEIHSFTPDRKLPRGLFRLAHDAR
jgi:hypothetical protein